jgi:hypothetical protein
MKNNDIPKKQIDAWRRREAEETADDCTEVVQHHAPLRHHRPRTATTRAARDRSGHGPRASGRGCVGFGSEVGTGSSGAMTATATMPTRKTPTGGRRRQKEWIRLFLFFFLFLPFFICSGPSSSRTRGG